jgi:hypothetical protein
MPTSKALVQLWQAVLWHQLLDDCADLQRPYGRLEQQLGGGLAIARPSARE